MKYVVFDMETMDPNIRTMGAGWCYPHHNSEYPFKVLCGVFIGSDGQEFITGSDPELIQMIIDQYDILVAHNAQYDLGCLEYLGVDYKDKQIHDTMIMSKLHNSSRDRYSLDHLAKGYLGKDTGKFDLVLADDIWNRGIYPWLKKEINSKERAEKKGETWERERPDDSKLIKYAKSHMDEVSSSALIKYCKQDVDITKSLYEVLVEKLKGQEEVYNKYCNLSKLCIKYRKNGVRIDKQKAQEIHVELRRQYLLAYQHCAEIAQEEVNINSPKELPPVFDRLGIEYPTTPKGNPSITTPWLEKQDHPLCKAIINARKIEKIDRDFIQKTLETADSLFPNDEHYGRVFPELNLMQARTGRFSCSNPNIQQIPSRDPKLGPLCRSIFIPEEGQKWFSLDFSNQEGRIQVHYASRLDCEGASLLVEEFKNNPNLDMHQLVADMAEISRKEAKAVNLGISYGMGISKLAAALGCSEQQAKIVRNKYNDLVPFLNELNKKCQKALKARGSIKTLGGRRVNIDPPVYVDGKKQTFEYKALNKLIQGSAADQTIEAMIKADEAGINVLFPVHDELCISGTREDAENLKVIMETCVNMEIPNVTDIGEGVNWAEAK